MSRVPNAHIIRIKITKMERNEYLKLCQRYAVYHDFTVMHNGIKYHTLGYTLKFDKTSQPIHIAILLDQNQNSVQNVPLHEVAEEK